MIGISSIVSVGCRIKTLLPLMRMCEYQILRLADNATPSYEANAMDTPATLKVIFAIGNPSAVVPLHCITVPFSLVVAVNVRVEVISATVPLLTVMGLAMFVSVATKLKSPIL